jgi:hypothetical protein
VGVLFTGWSAGGNGEHLLAAWKAEGSSDADQAAAKRQETGRQIAATIRAGLKELDARQDNAPPKR